LCDFSSRYNTEQSIGLQGDFDKKDQEIQTKVKLFQMKNEYVNNFDAPDAHFDKEVKNILSAKVKDTSDRDQIESHSSAQPISGRSHRISSAVSSLRSIHAQKKAKTEAARAKVEFLKKGKGTSDKTSSAY
jgi:hypothetical protein